MQEQPNAADNAEGVEGIKRYIVKDTWKDYEVTLEVNHAVLTPERAKLINDFWISAKDRLDECNGDVSATVVRLFGQSAICALLQDGGVCTTKESFLARISQELRAEEGWGGEDDAAGLFGWCGIRVVQADVEVPSFDDVELTELSA